VLLGGTTWGDGFFLGAAEVHEQCHSRSTLSEGTEASGDCEGPTPHYHDIVTPLEAPSPACVQGEGQRAYNCQPI